MNIPKKHPRYTSLKERHALLKGYEEGITALAGLIAHGRGEAFDYLMGEATIPPAKKAINAAAAALLLAKNPVISVNGNTVALCASDLVNLAKVCGAKLEINLFYRSNERVKKIEKYLRKHGASKVYGIALTKEIRGISSDRRRVDKEGIYSSDVVLVPLEDGDRAEALVRARKKVIAIDLNPLSRTSGCANITIVDNVTRALPKMISAVKKLKKSSNGRLTKIVEEFDNDKNCRETLKFINERLLHLSQLSGNSGRKL